MKRYDGLFFQVVDTENLYFAFEEARKGRKFKPEIMEASAKIEELIGDLMFSLSVGTWRPDEYHKFETRKEVKRRIINAPTFRDRIVHHALCRIVSPLFERKFIFDSYACRAKGTGKGTHSAVTRLQKFIRQQKGRSGKAYILQCDISKYYPSVDHELLKQEIRRTIADKMLLELWDWIIDGFSEKPGKGIPIGALTSQLSANIYLNPLDHFAKETLHIEFYLRYMDDFIVVAGSKEELRQHLSALRWFVEDRLLLTLNPKTQVFPAKVGVDFAGFRTFEEHILPRKRNIRAAKIRFKNLSHLYKHGKIGLDDVRPRVASFLGYVKHCKAQRTTDSTLRWLVCRRGEKNGNENGID